ncbi:MAG TPA: glycosyltransferase family 10 [Hymenobacter sp.]
MFSDLQQILAGHGIELATQDIYPATESDLIIALDQTVALKQIPLKPATKKYLLLNEPDTYYPENWSKENHAVFDRVFTYDYTLADQQKYIHHYFAIDLEGTPAFEPVSEEEFNRRGLCVLMAGMFQLTKPVGDSKSLLYDRYQTVKWFSRYQPQSFALYSRGINPRLLQSFRGLGVLQRVLPAPVLKQVTEVVVARRKSMLDVVSKGPVPPNAKISTFRNYRFAICYENTALPGYISEKIFDCFAAACVPIYLGEPEISRFIPSACYIDRREFKSDEELYNFIKNMTYTHYRSYIQAMSDFVQGVEHNKFGSVPNAERIAKVILEDLHIPTTL